MDQPVPEKTCSKCGPKPLTDFSPSKRKGTGTAECKACHAAYMRNYYARDKGPWAKRMSAYKKAHRAELNAKERARRHKILADPILGPKELERCRKQTAKYATNHPERAKASVARYGATHKDSINARRRQRYAEDPSKPLANNKRRKALIRGAPIADLTAAEWLRIKEHYGHRCVYCGRKMKRLTQDHITPVSKGGSHTYTNVVPACQSCNAKKRDGAVLKPIQPLLLL